MEFEPDEEDEAVRSDPGDEERMKTRGGAYATGAYGYVAYVD